MKLFSKIPLLALSILFIFWSMAVFSAPNKGKNGAELAAYTTVDICSVSPDTYRYFGVISIWNQGSVDTEGLVIDNDIQSKEFTQSGKFTDTYEVSQFDPVLTVIPAYTTQETALTTKYSFEGPALIDSYIRNSAQVTITNHSGHLGEAFGPNPKASYAGVWPPVECPQDKGCVLGLGYWKNTADGNWPVEIDRNSLFFHSTKTWQQILTITPKGNGYYILAAQYATAILNTTKADRPALTPDGVHQTLELAETWLNTNTPSVCPTAGSCGLQKTWGAVLEQFNSGNYPDGPQSCNN